MIGKVAVPHKGAQIRLHDFLRVGCYGSFPYPILHVLLGSFRDLDVLVEPLIAVTEEFLSAAHAPGRWIFENGAYVTSDRIENEKESHGRFVDIGFRELEDGNCT